jgi:hypothetical protein
MTVTLDLALPSAATNVAVSSTLGVSGCSTISRYVDFETATAIGDDLHRLDESADYNYFEFD